jgi:hypothetical protein
MSGLEGTLGWIGESCFDPRAKEDSDGRYEPTQGPGRWIDHKQTQGQAARTPGHDEIAMRAFEIYLSRGGWPGRDVDDWLEAERQLLGP